MIIATIELYGREEKRREIVQTINGISDQVRLLEGCINVNSYQDINNQNLFYHVEEWQTTQALDNYLNSKLFSAFLGISTILADMPKIKIMITDQIAFIENNTAHPFKIRLKEQNGVT